VRHLDVLAARYVPPGHPRDRRGCALAWSQLAHLETVAGRVAALARDQRQVADEASHHAALRRLAEACGGFDPAPCPAVAALGAWLDGLPVSYSRVALNLFAEAQFVALFAALADLDVAPELLRHLARDEADHVDRPVPWRQLAGDDVVGVLRELEDLVEALTLDPAFVVPLSVLAGPLGLTEVVLRLTRAHVAACARLGLRPGLRRVRARALAHRAVRRQPPAPRPATLYEAARLTWWRDATAAAQVLRGEVPARSLGRVLRALGDALMADERCRVVHRGGRLYVATRALVGVRVTVPGGVDTVHLEPAGREPRDLTAQLARRRRWLRARPYAAPPDLRGLEDLLPPSEVVAWVAWLRGVPGSSGHGPLVEAEGVPLALTLGGPRAGVVRFELVGDHRCLDGGTLDALAAAWTRGLTDG
jgi:hypothetical protein